MPSDWKIYAAAVIFLTAGAAWLWIGQLRSERDLLALQVKTLARENVELAASAQAVIEAAQAQSVICRTEILRRDRIEEIFQNQQPAAAEELSPPKPAVVEEAVDVSVSTKAIDLLNHDLFAPLGPGVRRAGE